LSTTDTTETPVKTTETPLPMVADGSATRFRNPISNYGRLLFGLPSHRRLAQAALKVGQVRHYESEYARLSDAELLAVGKRLRGRARGGESLDSLVPEAYGAVCVAVQRAHRMRPFDVQIAGSVILHIGGIAELVTGEGKTLVATLPTFLHALKGKGVHVSTVNDYLARRDAEWTGAIYSALGLTTGVIQMQMPDDVRTEAYQRDITYGTASEFGFDFLRDQLKLKSSQGRGRPFWSAWGEAGAGPSGPPKGVQRGHYFVLIDEADNILIDEARTPLIISGEVREATAEEQVVYKWADGIARQMKREEHFRLDDKTLKVELSEEGKRLVRWSNPPSGPQAKAMDKINEHVERAVQANFRFRLDQHYMIEKDKIVIIDEYTGRRMPDRQWREGLHQAVEAKEGVPITYNDSHAAQITYQSYFRLYHQRAGMTGTARPDNRELKRVYDMRVVPVPTNRRVVRTQWPDRVFPTEAAKFDAVVEEVARLHGLGRPVLIGTRSVDKSEALSQRLKAIGIEHQVLNARQHDQEAKIVADAGQVGRVTLATNMAGRGTDIKLGAGVAAAGGLHVLGTERHDARRIDRQLAGRSGRQGDPGTCQFFLSLEDELLEALGPERQQSLKEIGQRGGNADWQKYLPLFYKAQRIVEARHYRQRIDLMYYEKQRQETLKEIGADPYVD
jgi:preprotein translocase subunit SecA